MGRIFGTDGVRGLANADLTPEFAMPIAIAAAHTLAEHDRTHPPVAIVGRDPRASGEMLEAAVVAGLTSTGADRGAGRRAADARPGVPGHLDRRRPRRDDLRVAQPDAGQRHQAVLRRRAQAARRRSRTRSATRSRRCRPARSNWDRPTGAGVGRVHDLLDGAEHYVTHLVDSAPNSLAGIKVVVDCANGAASDRRARGLRGGRRRGHRDLRRAGRPEHQRRLRLDAPRRAAGRGAGQRRPPRHRPRRRRRPLPRGRRRTATSSTATRSWRSWRWPCARPAQLTDDTLVATVMSNLGLQLGDGATPASSWSRPRSATGTCWRRCRPAATRSAASRAATSCCRPSRHDRRRRADRAAADGPDGGHRPFAGRPGRRWSRSCRRCSSTCRSATGAAAAAAPTCRPR